MLARKSFFQSLSFRLTAAAILAIGISFSVFTFFNIKINASLLTEELEKKIVKTVEYNVANIDGYTSSMEQKATELALAGEMFYRIRSKTTSTSTDEEIKKYLIDSFKTFPQAVGGGLWFEPNVFYSSQEHYGPYAFWSEKEVTFTWDLSTPEYDYHTQDWYTRALPIDWNRDIKPKDTHYWTAPYYDEAGSYSLMVTVDAFMYDETGRIIGITTADLSTEEMLAFLKKDRISFDSQIFLVDGVSNFVMINTLDEGSVMKVSSAVPWLASFRNSEIGKIKKVGLTINGLEYLSFYTQTEAGMLYGISVPKQVLQDSIYKLLSLNVLMLLLLAFFLLLAFYKILSHVTRPILRLTEAVQRIAEGDLSVQLKEDSQNEIGILTRAFNSMTTKLKSSYENMEKIVEKKTHALSDTIEVLESKRNDLEKAQLATTNLLEDLEEEKHTVEKKVIERTLDLEREKNKLLRVTTNMQGGGILLDENHEVVFINEFASKILSVPATGVSAEAFKKIFFAYFSSKEIQVYFNRCLNGETFRVSEIEGGGRLYEMFFHFIQSPSEDKNEPPAYFILFFDITEVKLLERSKSELVAVASHQLRTPLTAMRGNLEMLADESYGAVNDEQRELLNDLETSTIRLIKMVNEMLDITKIEKGDLELVTESLNVKEILDSVVKDLEVYAKRHEFTISMSDVDSNLLVLGDRMRVRQIFQNLIDNAIKYSTHPGKLNISTFAREKVVEINFKDNGIGIPKNEQSKIFGRFYRASNTSKTTSSGSGLGLHIIESIAGQLGGNLQFESKEGEGTTFFVTLLRSK